MGRESPESGQSKNPLALPECCSFYYNMAVATALVLTLLHCCCWAPSVAKNVYLAGQMLPPSSARRISRDSCDRPTECTECCNHVCSECLVALPRPIGANADLIDDYYGFYTCCLCCIA